MYEEEQEHVPNFVITPQEAASMRCGGLYFYPKDIKKMETMSPREMMKYRLRCLRAGRYSFSKEEADSHKGPPLDWMFKFVCVALLLFVVLLFVFVLIVYCSR